MSVAKVASVSIKRASSVSPRTPSTPSSRAQLGVDILNIYDLQTRVPVFVPVRVSILARFAFPAGNRDQNWTSEWMKKVVDFLGNTPLASPPSASSTMLVRLSWVLGSTGGYQAKRFRGDFGETTCDPWHQIQARPKERVVCARCKGPSQRLSGCTVHGALQLVATFVKRPSQQSANQSAINPFQLTAHHYLQLFGTLLFNQPPPFCHQLLLFVLALGEDDLNCTKTSSNLEISFYGETAIDERSRKVHSTVALTCSYCWPRPTLPLPKIPTAHFLDAS